MKRVEISYRKSVAQLAKLQERIEKAEKTLEKRKAIAEKYGVADWTYEQYRKWISGVESTEAGFIINQCDIDKNGAYYDLISAQGYVDEIRHDIEFAEKKLAESEEKLEAHRAEVARIENAKEREKLYQMEFEAQKKEWAKDGITLTGNCYGITPKGLPFAVYGNHGITERSRYCFTLQVNGETVFTSGEFWRAYMEIKNR